MRKTWICVAAVLWSVSSTALAGNLEEGAGLFGRQKYAEAVELLKKALDDDPGSAKAYLFLASSYEKLTQWPEAVKAWEKYIKFAKGKGELDYGLTRLKDCRQRAKGKGIITEPESKEDPDKYSDFRRHDGPFQSIRSDHFLVLCKSPALGRLASKEAERHLKRITGTFIEGREWPHVITVRIHKNHPDYVKEAGTPQWSGGGYLFRNYGPANTIRRIELYALDKDGKYIPELLTKTLPHELTHLVLHEYFGERTFKGLPLALNEGLAMYVEEGTAVRYEKQLASAVKKGVYYKLKELFKMQRYPRNVGLFYAQSSSSTRYIIEHLNAEQFQKFLAAIRRGSDINSALQTATGRTGDLITAMEANWVAMLKKKAKEYAKADDGKPEKKPEKKPVPAPVTSEPKPTDDEEDVIIEVE